MYPPKLLVLGAVAAAADVVAAFQLKDAADYEVNRDLLEESYPAYKSFHGAMHAGLMPAWIDDGSASDDYSSYSFWLFQPDVESGDPDDDADESFRNDTLLVWFNGGPGCSSFVGLMGEMGPVGIAKFGPGIPSPNPATLMDAPLVENEYAWTKKSAMLFVEQPGGTGFSTASSEWTDEEAEKRTEDDVASAFWAFLQNMYATFEELGSKKLYLSGESYAGMYIPSIARGIHLRNVDLQIGKNMGESEAQSLQMVNLRGLAIGNGWIDPMIQGPTTIDFAWWHGMIDLQTYRGLHEMWDECVARKITDSAEKPFHPFTMPDECGISQAVMKASGSNFQYDVTTYDAYPAVLNKGKCIIRRRGSIFTFFNNPNVRAALNYPTIEEHPQWQACVEGSGRRRRLEASQQRKLILLDNDAPSSVVPYIAELLDDAKLDILMYNGDLDLACSSQSTELALESMEWTGKQGWMDSDATKWKQWTVDGEAAGHTKQLKNLQFLVVYNSGHFVPINQARNSLNMIGRLLDGKTMGDKQLHMFPPREKKHPEESQGTEPSKGMSDDSEEVTPDGEGQKNERSFLPGLVGFLLGILAHFLITKHSLASRKTWTPSSSSHTDSMDVTETTPLNIAP
ncbi:hypothetical protein ACHAWF_014881 [Thalassiosira exigua]